MLKYEKNILLKMLARNYEIIQQKRQEFILNELNRGVKVSEIAKALNLSKTSIYREIKEIELKFNNNEKVAKNIIDKIKRRNETENSK